jgi:predicted RNA-binding Zn ribbon-like protein
VDLETLAEFLNTRDDRTYGHFVDKPDSERDTVATPAALARWLERNRLVGKGTRLSAADHRFAIRLRESLRAALGTGDHRDLNALARELPMVVDFDADGAFPKLTRMTRAGRSFVADVLFLALAATATGDWRLMKMCAADDCHWIFHDQSRNHFGRWCNMDVCGNRVKTRKYRERTRRAGERSRTTGSRR